MLTIFRGIASKLAPSVSILSNVCSTNSQLHTSAALSRDGPTQFISYNDKKFPPQQPDETPRLGVSLEIIFLFCFNRNAD